MLYTQLNNQTQIPNLGIGTFRLSPVETEQSVLHALQNGYRLIDTANAYLNEKAVGRAIKASGLAREEIYLTTKLWPTDYKYEKAVQAIDSSLKRLGVDYLDLLLLHQPVGNVRSAWKAMEEAVQAGKVKSIGISNFTESDLEKLLATATIKPVVNQVECHPYFQQTSLKAKLAQHNIALEAWYPLGSANKDLLAEPIFQQLAEKYHKTAIQIILRWHVQSGNIIIPGSKNPHHVDSNMAIFDFHLTQEEMQQIAVLDKGKSFFNMPRFMKYLFLLARINYENQE